MVRYENAVIAATRRWAANVLRGALEAGAVIPNTLDSMAHRGDWERSTTEEVRLLIRQLETTARAHDRRNGNG